jgi:hypothetical protein
VTPLQRPLRCNVTRVNTASVSNVRAPGVLDLTRSSPQEPAALVDPNLDLLALEDGPVGLQGWLLTLRSYQAVPSFTGYPFSAKPYSQSTASAVAADAVAAALDEFAALAAAEG